MAKIIEELKPDEAYVDAADVIQERFGEAHPRMPNNQNNNYIPP